MPPLLPERIVDCHHHFLAPREPFHATLGGLGVPPYTAEQYAADCAAGGAALSDRIVKTVHVEAIADDGLGEAAAVEALASSGACKVAAIVANCDLAADDEMLLIEELLNEDMIPPPPPDDDEEMLDDVEMLEWAGISFGEMTNQVIQKSLKRLARVSGARFL